MEGEDTGFAHTLDWPPPSWDTELVATAQNSDLEASDPVMNQKPVLLTPRTRP